MYNYCLKYVFWNSYFQTIDKSEKIENHTMWFQELKSNLIFSHSGCYLLLLKTLLLDKLTWEVWEQTPPVKQGKEVFFGYFSIFHVLCHLLSYSIQQQAHVNLFLIFVFDVRFGCPSSQLPGSSWVELWICWCHAWKPRGDFGIAPWKCISSSTSCTSFLSVSEVHCSANLVSFYCF